MYYIGHSYLNWYIYKKKLSYYLLIITSSQVSYFICQTHYQLIYKLCETHLFESLS
jgi:hypothetical protein